MPRRRCQVLDHGRVDRGRVGNDLDRCHLQRSESSLEEPARRGRIPAGRDQHVDDLPVLVDGPVDVAPDTVYPDICFVHVPPVARCVASEPGGVGQQRSEPLDPPEHRDVVDLDTALDQELLDVAVGQAVAQVPADRDHDDIGREPKPGES
jgi:hypothetical protein